MQNSGSHGAGEIIGEWEYFRGPNGDLYREWLVLRPSDRHPRFMAPNRHADFGLRIARMAAGQPEFGK
jgi:hypothetical protein